MDNPLGVLDELCIAGRKLALFDQRSAKIEMQRSDKIELPTRIVRLDAQGSSKTF